MNQAKAHEILDNRLAQVHSLLTAFIAAGGRRNEDLDCQTLSNAMWAIQEFIEQAQKALPHIGCHGAHLSEILDQPAVLAETPAEKKIIELLRAINASDDPRILAILQAILTAPAANLERLSQEPA